MTSSSIEDVERKILLDIIAKQNETIRILSEKKDGLSSLTEVLGPLVQTFLKSYTAGGGGLLGGGSGVKAPWDCFPNPNPNPKDIFKQDTADPTEAFKNVLKMGAPNDKERKKIDEQFENFKKHGRPVTDSELDKDPKKED